MSLRSMLFKGDPKLEACLLYDHAHVTPGTRGDHVAKIQFGLWFLATSIPDASLKVDPAELRMKWYGRSTSAAVLSFKKARKIINPAYQTKPDNIVGKMTIAALDKEVCDRIGPAPPVPVIPVDPTPGREPLPPGPDYTVDPMYVDQITG
ncbi:MAG: hypothetical protein JOY71_17175, partial [Acetobacteraceae bacterium]|nr:hypothetical protein [Acetobacteraceae bacterium]